MKEFGIIVAVFLGIIFLVFTNLPAIHRLFEKKPKENSTSDNVVENNIVCPMAGPKRPAYAAPKAPGCEKLRFWDKLCCHQSALAFDAVMNLGQITMTIAAGRFWILARVFAHWRDKLCCRRPRGMTAAPIGFAGYADRNFVWVKLSSFDGESACAKWVGRK